MNDHTRPARAATHIAGLMIARAVRAPLWLLVSAVLARVLEPEGLGIWSMILAAAALLNQLLLFWTQSITQRFGPGEWISKKRLTAIWATRWPLVAACLVAAVFVVVADPLDWLAHTYHLDGGLRWYVLPALGILWLMGECQALQQIRERFGSLAWSPITADVAFLAMLGALLLAKMRAATLDFQVTALCLLGTGLSCWVFWLFRELRPMRFALPLPSGSDLRRAIAFALPLVPGALVGYFAEWCDYFLIRHFYAEHEVGLFHPAYQYMLILVGLPTAVAAVLLPRLSGQADTDGGAGARQLIERRAPQLTVLWILPALAIVAILPAVFAWLLGPRYEASTDLLRVLLVAAPGAIVTHVYGIAYFVQGRLGVATVVLFGAKGLVNLAMSYVLLPKVGLLGSALGSACSYIVLQWLFVLEQHRFQRLPLGVGAVALLFAHLPGIALALVDGTAIRLLLVAGTAVLVLGWARRSALFSGAEISALIPNRLAWTEGPLRRVLMARTP